MQDRIRDRSFQISLVPWLFWKVPDLLIAGIHGIPVKEVIKDTKWLETDFTEKVQKRGGALIQKWGRSLAAATAVLIVDGIRSLVTPTSKRDWFSSGVYTTENPYGIAEDIVFSMPCRSKGDGDYELVKDVIIDDYLRNRIKKSISGHKSAVESIAFDSSEVLVAAGASIGVINMWNLEETMGPAGAAVCRGCAAVVCRGCAKIHKLKNTS